MSARPCAAVCLLLLLITAPCVARADVLPRDYRPPVCQPLPCPRGAVGAGGGHGSCPSVCVPWYQTCATAAECGTGQSCVPTRFCLERRILGRAQLEQVVGTCAADGSCERGTCTEASRCVPDAAPPPRTPPPRAPGSTSASMAGCSVSQARHASALAFGLLVSAGLVLARRRRAR